MVSTRSRPRHRCLPLLAALLVVAGGCTQLKKFAYEGFDRDSWQHPDEVIRTLEIRPGDQVADLGSGGGYFTFRLAEAVGGEGKVYAVDVDADMNADLAGRAREQGYHNIETILAEYADPLLPIAGVDLIFTCDTYHHIQNRSAYFANARKYLRPGGRVAVIDYNDEGWFPRWFGHQTPAEVIRSEMEQAGYRLLAQPDFLPRQHFLIFAVVPAAS